MGRTRLVRAPLNTYGKNEKRHTPFAPRRTSRRHHATLYDKFLVRFRDRGLDGSVWHDRARSHDGTPWPYDDRGWAMTRLLIFALVAVAVWSFGPATISLLFCSLGVLFALMVLR